MTNERFEMIVMIKLADQIVYIDVRNTHEVFEVWYYPIDMNRDDRKKYEKRLHVCLCLIAYFSKAIRESFL